MTSGKFSYGLSISMSGQPAFRKRTGGGVLVMTADAVSRIVIEGTLRRMGIACRSLDMAALAPVADGEMPDLVILDCTKAADLCRRHAGILAGRDRAKLIVIGDETVPEDVPADMILRKPIIPDRLEQAVFSLLGTQD